MVDTLAGLPEAVQEAARSSLGGALQVANTIGGAQGATLTDVARSSFTDGMGLALTIGGVVALVASVLVWMILPSEVAPSEYQPAQGPDEVDVLVP